MKRILIDLDVVTVALWDKNDDRRQTARYFISRLKNGTFHVVTPHALLDLVAQWNDKNLKKEIETFYWNFTNEFVDRIDVINQINADASRGDFETIFLDLEQKDVKEEDIFLILVSAAMKLDLVTFNRKHLKNKEAEINDILSQYGIGTIRILLPNEA